MADKVFNGRIIHKNDIEENWEKAINFIPKKSELIIYNPDNTHAQARVKVGDGVTKVNDLPFIVDDVKPVTTVNGKTGASIVLTAEDIPFDDYENYPTQDYILLALNQANTALEGNFKNYVFRFYYDDITIKFSGTGKAARVIGLLLISRRNSCIEPISIGLYSNSIDDEEEYRTQTIYVSNNTYGIEGRANCELFVPATVGGGDGGNIRVILFEQNVTCSLLSPS